MLRVFDDADNLELRLQLPLETEVLPDCLAVEIAIGEDLIHNRNFATMIVIAIRKKAA